LPVTVWNITGAPDVQFVHSMATDAFVSFRVGAPHPFAFAQ